MRKLPFILAFSLFPFSWVGASCSIEKGPPPELVKYFESVRTEVTKIRGEAGSQSQCNGKNGTFSQERRYLELFDRVDLDGQGVESTFGLPLDLAQSFVSNIINASEGKSNGPVVAHGNLFRNIEKTALTPAIESVTALCALDVSLGSGGTPETRFANLLRNHRKIERYFHAATLGNPTPPPDLEEWSDLTSAIAENYSPEKTASCKSPYKMEEAMKTIKAKLENITKGTYTSQDNWKEAIALFQGKSNKPGEYAKLQARLLSAEMARQGLTKNAKEAMIKKLGCVNKRVNESATFSDRMEASFECNQNMVAGLETFTNPFKKIIALSKTTDEYLVRTLTASREKNRLGTDMGAYWTTLSKLQYQDTGENQKIINDLMGIHIDLTATTLAIKKAIPEMAKNCMKGNPGAGGCEY